LYFVGVGLDDCICHGTFLKKNRTKKKIGEGEERERQQEKLK
jgi:hypothetical protein